MKFTSPLVVRPKAKQIAYCLVAGVLLAALQLWLAVSALGKTDLLSALSALLLLGAAVYHVWIVVHDIRRDVTAMIPSIAVLAGAQMLRNVLLFIGQGSLSFKGSFLLLMEIAFWCAFVVCAKRAVCGKYKLLVPLVFLFFAFFYTFIKFELRDIAALASQIGLLLILWFPIDAIAFTSLYPGNDKF